MWTGIVICTQNAQTHTHTLLIGKHRPASSWQPAMLSFTKGFHAPSHTTQICAPANWTSMSQPGSVAHISKWMDSRTEMPHEEMPHQKRSHKEGYLWTSIAQQFCRTPPNLSFHQATLKMSRRSFVLPARRRSVVSIFHFVVPGTAGAIEGKVPAKAHSRFCIAR